MCEELNTLMCDLICDVISYCVRRLRYG